MIDGRNDGQEHRPGGEVVSSGVPDVDDVKRPRVLLPVHHQTHPAHVVASSDHAYVACVVVVVVSDVMECDGVVGNVMRCNRVVGDVMECGHFYGV